MKRGTLEDFSIQFKTLLVNIREMQATDPFAKLDAMMLDAASELTEASAYNLVRSDTFSDVTELMLTSSRLANMSKALKENNLAT